MMLPTCFLRNEVPFHEHENWHNGGVKLAPVTDFDQFKDIYFREDRNSPCVTISNEGKLNTSYYVGMDWLSNEKAIYVQPKLLADGPQTDYLQMLFCALRHPNISTYTEKLFEIKWEAKTMSIRQKDDLLTPLLAVEFLRLVKEIVRKGLKKSYYRKEANLYSRVKGKVLVSQTIKRNTVKSKMLHNYCVYEEFGINGLENRLLKKALLFLQRYLPRHANLESKYTKELFNYIRPAFEKVSASVSLNEIKQTPPNPFYAEYNPAIKLAKLILRRFGYNIQNTEQQLIETPPFWIDMARLFELYVLDRLIARYGAGSVKYHLRTYGNELDFLILGQDGPLVVDAKYKRKYKEKNDHIDIRQISGYARLQKVYETAGIKDKTQIIPARIIYPNQTEKEKLDDSSCEKLNDYVEITKQGIKLPTLSE